MAKKKKKPATLNEQALLREDGAILFDAEVEVLLKSLRPRYDGLAAKAAEGVARDVREVAMSAMVQEEEPTLSLLRDKVCVARPAKEACVRIEAAPATDAAVVGSWLTRTCVKAGASLDVAVTMPKGLIGPKDHVNGRYFEKRWAYLQLLARALMKEKGLLVTVKDLGGDARRPILVVRRPEVPPGKQYAVHVLPVWPESSITFAKLGPRWNGCRMADGGRDAHTPGYNDALLRDAAVVSRRHVSFIFDAVKQVPALGDAIVLAKAWLMSRGQLPRPDGIDSTIVSLLCVQLLKKESTAIGIFRAFLKCLVDDWGPSKPRVVTTTEAVEGLWSPADFASHEVIFLDNGGIPVINLAARVSTGAYLEIQTDARAALSLARRDAPFLSLFPVAGRPAYLSYDAIVRVPVRPLVVDDDDDAMESQVVKKHKRKRDEPAKVSRGRNGAWLAFPELSALGEPLKEAVGRFAATVVAKALESRHAGVRPLVDVVQVDGKFVSTFFAERSLDDDDDDDDDEDFDHVAVGVRLRRDDAAFRPALRGPRPDEVDRGREFRDFWGDKAQLRRFRDGAVVEAVVWDEPETGTFGGDWKRAVPERAVRYALARHLSSRCSDGARRAASSDDDAARASYARATFDGSVVAVASTVATTGFGPPQTPGGLHAAVESLEAACKRVCSMATFPLRLDALSPASAYLRGTAPLGEPAWDPYLAPPSAAKKSIGRCGQAVDVVARFEHSSKWAALTTAAARKAAAQALVARLATGLADDVDLAAGLRFVGFVPSLEEDDDTIAAPHLRVLFAGYAFRISPLFLRARKDSSSPPEVEMTTPKMNGKKTPQSRRRPCRLDCPGREPAGVREIAFLHHARIRAAAGRYPALGPTVRLFGRWCAAQLFSGHLSHEVLEVLAAAAFLDDVPPNSAVAGFLRCLRLLWSRDWDTPLLVDLREDEDDHRKVEEGTPTIEVALGLCVEYGASGSSELASQFLRLDVAPEKPVLRLMQAAAKETERVFGERWLGPDVVDRGALDILEAAIGRRGGRATKRAFDAWLVLRKDVVSRGVLRLDDLDAAAKAATRGPPAYRSLGVGGWKKYANLDDDDDKNPDRAFARDRSSAVLDPNLAPRAFVATDPVADFVDDLRATFGQYALFFYDALEPTLVGIVWRPYKPRPFASTTAAYTRPVPSPDDDSFLVEPNFDEILHDCARLGDHLILETKTSSRAPTTSSTS